MSKINSNWVLSEVSYGAKYCNPKKNLEQHILCVKHVFPARICHFLGHKNKKKRKRKNIAPNSHTFPTHRVCIYSMYNTSYILQPNQLALPIYSMWILIKEKFKIQKWPSWACGVKGIFYMCILNNHFASTFRKKVCYLVNYGPWLVKRTKLTYSKQ
jgi:hypothetical protein